MAKVELTKVTKKYDGADDYTIRETDLVIHDKEFMILVGPSGCGKSTTLRMIAGLEDITSGEVKIGSRIVNDVPPKERDIAMVFQNYALYPHMNVYDNMSFGLKLRKYSKAEIESRVIEAAKILGIEDLLSRKPKELSGGQRQRVALGRAIVRHPHVFLMDEPLSNLDAKLRVHMRAEIIKLHQRLETTMIYVTHDQVEAMTMGDRIAIFNKGVIQQVGNPQEIYKFPANIFVAGFIGSPAMNFFKGKLKKQDGKTVFSGDGVEFTVTSEQCGKLGAYSKPEIIIGIRPENMFLEDFSKVPSTVENTIKAVIDVIEPMGNEYFLSMKIQSKSFTIRVDGDAKPVLNEMINLIINRDSVRFFDAESEELIC